MNAKTKKTKADVPFDPVLFAATVPGRKPTPNDLADTKEHQDDATEPQEYDSMEDMVIPERILNPATGKFDNILDAARAQALLNLIQPQSKGTTGREPPLTDRRRPDEP